MQHNPNATQNIMGMVMGYFSVLIADVNGAFQVNDWTAFLCRVIATGFLGAASGWLATRLMNLANVHYKKWRKSKQ